VVTATSVFGLVVLEPIYRLRLHDVSGLKGLAVQKFGSAKQNMALMEEHIDVAETDFWRADSMRAFLLSSVVG
jgi:hypothetical protein